MSSGAGTSLAHRGVASIKSSSTAEASATSPAPLTPTRVTTSSFGSPSTLRADDDFIILEMGSRFVRAGFAGDASPKACLTCGPDQQRRAGDYRAWQRPSPAGSSRWDADYELWSYDVRNLDLALFRDKLDRLLRDTFTRFLLIDSRPRRVGLVLDSAVPIPLLSSVLDTLFTNFNSPIVSLMPIPTMAAVGAGLRSALVVDMGWNETVVTSVYEYRQVKSTRTVRAGRSLNEQLYKLLHGLIPTAEDDEESPNRLVSFVECEDVLCRLMWCRPSAYKSGQRQPTQLDTVDEQDESEGESTQPTGIAEVPLGHTTPPSTVHIPFNKLADVCDDAFFDPAATWATFDDHDLPLHLLVYQHLLRLPLDVRATCMARIVFIGGCSNILGVKERIIDEVAGIVTQRGWEPVVGKGRDQLRSRPRVPVSGSGAATEALASEASTAQPQEDVVEAKVTRNRPVLEQLRGQFRAVHSLGPWAGASLLCQLKIPAMATVDRELWQQHGASGASRPSEVDVKAQQRQSMGASGFLRSSGGHHANWTLGIWGNL